MLEILFPWIQQIQQKDKNILLVPSQNMEMVRQLAQKYISVDVIVLLIQMHVSNQMPSMKHLRHLDHLSISLYRIHSPEPNKHTDSIEKSALIMVQVSLFPPDFPLFFQQMEYHQRACQKSMKMDYQNSI